MPSVQSVFVQAVAYMTMHIFNSDHSGFYTESAVLEDFVEQSQGIVRKLIQ